MYIIPSILLALATSNHHHLFSPLPISRTLSFTCKAFHSESMCQVHETGHSHRLYLLVFTKILSVCLITSMFQKTKLANRVCLYALSPHPPGRPKSRRRRLLRSPPWSDLHPRPHVPSPWFPTGLSVLWCQLHPESRKGVHSQAVEPAMEHKRR